MTWLYIKKTVLNVKPNDYSSLVFNPPCVLNQVCVEVWKVSKYES